VIDKRELLQNIKNAAYGAKVHEMEAEALKHNYQRRSEHLRNERDMAATSAREKWEAALRVTNPKACQTCGGEWWEVEEDGGRCINCGTPHPCMLDTDEPKGKT
jgi:hypothetical protein